MSEYIAYKDTSLDAKTRARDLVNRMTVEECASNMIFGAKGVDRLGVKDYNWWNEALHGVARCGMATVFPQAIGLASTFDDELIGKMARVIATEGRAKYNQFQKYEDYGIYKGITYWSPNVNIFRDPRWGRGQETYGEDPYLAGKLGVAFVKGLQEGEDNRYMKTAACAKHYAVHSGPEDRRHEFDAIASEQDMAETYLPAFKELCDAGVEGFMGAYNRTNGEPCCGSETLLKNKLRGEWGFDGYVTSDCWAIGDFHLHHHVTATPAESVKLALENGCDLNCGNMYDHLMLALEEGKITEEMIRESAVRLMTTRMRLGMFDETEYDKIPYSVVDCEEHRRLNYEIACRSLVLLKNEGMLPLDKAKLKNVAVIGPNANSITPLLGNYHGTGNQYYTVLEAVRAALPDARVNYSRGSHLYEYKLEDPGYAGDCLSEVKTQCEQADIVILVVGLDETYEGEEMITDVPHTGDKVDLYLPQTQRDLVKTVCDSGVPFVLVNMSGSAIDFEYGNECAGAIVQAWYPGAVGGKAVSDLLFGEYSPSGKLPVTFYYNDNKLPGFEDYAMEGRTYKFIREKALFPFGHGLSYSEFAFSGLATDKAAYREGEDVQISLTITNTGSMQAEEVVQLYLRDEAASVRVPHHKLVGAKRVALLPGESAAVQLTVDAQQLCVVDEQGNYVFEPGVFTMFAGGCQPLEDYTPAVTCVSVRFTAVTD